MFSKVFISVGLASLTAGTALAQTLVVDQASGTLEESITTGSVIPAGSIAQSFTPSLGAVGFVQLRSLGIQPGTTTVTLAINLREGAYNGPILSSTDPVVLVQQFTDLRTFHFSANLPITPGQLYFFEPVILSAGSLSVGYKSPSPYDGGDSWNNGIPSGGFADYWFREGIVVPVPEPGLAWLGLLGAGILWLSRRPVV